MYSAKIDTEKKWDPLFYQTSPIFKPLKKWAEYFSVYDSWPGLDDYQALLSEQPDKIKTESGKVLKIVGQDGKPGHFSEHYAPRIYFSGEIQTRTENWHDFFQYLTWFMFPVTKGVINSIHIPAAEQRLTSGQSKGKRSSVENMLSLFDEGGAVILSSDETLLQLIREFRWKTLFWERRDDLNEGLEFVTFGHALYEKGLAPYIGMTANCILLHVEDSVLKLDTENKLKWIDRALSDIFTEGDLYQKPKDLSPFPVLGLPGWHKDNENESFYNDQDYFRPGRKSKVST